MASQSGATQPKAEGSLTNNDVVGMVKAGIGADIIVAKIKTATCSFDTSAAALKEVKDAGVPDSVVLAMVQAPKSAQRIDSWALSGEAIAPWAGN